MNNMQRVDIYQPEEQLRKLVNGFKMKEYLFGGSLRHLTLEDADHWINNPMSYPVDFRNKKLFLWGSLCVVDGAHCVPCLEWCAGRIIRTNTWLGDAWHKNRYAAIIKVA